MCCEPELQPQVVAEIPDSIKAVYVYFPGHQVWHSIKGQNEALESALDTFKEKDQRCIFANGNLSLLLYMSWCMVVGIFTTLPCYCYNQYATKEVVKDIFMDVPDLEHLAVTSDNRTYLSFTKKSDLPVAVLTRELRDRYKCYYHADQEGERWSGNFDLFVIEK
tara:strand:- start:8 stop:499 length:492 start_codon:yes stop_codon:yes gene_type:complete